MALTIAVGQAEALALLATIGDSEFDQFLRALRLEKPSISLDDLALRTAISSELDEELVSDLVLLASSLSSVRDRLGESVSTFVDDLLATAKESVEPALLAVSDWTNARIRLIALLSIESPLGVSAKAMDVLGDSERLFCRARVLTDLRPIFSVDASKGPISVLVTHSLRINFHAGPRRTIEQFFVTLADDDLRKLRDVLDRAMSKEESLRKFAKEKDIECLNFTLEPE